jgi:hypothetical protein
MTKHIHELEGSTAPLAKINLHIVDGNAWLHAAQSCLAKGNAALVELNKERDKVGLPALPLIPAVGTIAMIEDTATIPDVAVVADRPQERLDHQDEADTPVEELSEGKKPAATPKRAASRTHGTEAKKALWKCPGCGKVHGGRYFMCAECIEQGVRPGEKAEAPSAEIHD